MSHLLDDLMDLLGYDLPEQVKLTADLTCPSVGEKVVSDSKDGSIDLSDRFDLTKRDLQGKFHVGGTYRSRRVECICAMSSADRAATDAAGWPRAGAVVIDGVGLLVDDLTRLMIDGRFLVLGYVDFTNSQQAPTGRRGRRGRRD